MKTTDIEKKTDEDLNKLLNEKREELRQFRFNMAGSRVRDTKEGKQLRQDIAQLLHELGNRATASA